MSDLNRYVAKDEDGVVSKEKIRGQYDGEIGSLHVLDLHVLFHLAAASTLITQIFFLYLFLPLPLGFANVCRQRLGERFHIFFATARHYIGV